MTVLRQSLRNRVVHWGIALSCFGLIATGILQMPVAKRYGLTVLAPATGDYFLTLVWHYGVDRHHAQHVHENEERSVIFKRLEHGRKRTPYFVNQLHQSYIFGAKIHLFILFTINKRKKMVSAVLHIKNQSPIGGFARGYLSPCER